MDIKIPKIIRPLRLAEYAQELKDEIQVWVNPPVKLLNEYDELNRQTRDIFQKLVELNKPAEGNPTAPVDIGSEDSLSVAQPAQDLSPEEKEDLKKELGKELESIGLKKMEFFSQIWSQGPERTHCSVEDIKRWTEAAIGTDPRFLFKLQETTIDMIVEHRTQTKKG